MPDLPTSADVVIIGAGVIGCSTAYHLTVAGVRDVVVVEMGQMGSGSSGKSASILSLQLATDELTARMALHSYRRYMHLEKELGFPIDFRQHGRLAVATQDVADQLRSRAQHFRRLGIASDVLEADEIHRRFPQINVDDIVCGTWSEESGTFDPHMILSAFASRARQNGAHIGEGVRATGLDAGEGRVRAVVTSHGRIAAGVVVNAAGPWAAEVGQWAGLHIPIVNRARTVLVTAPFPYLPAGFPFVKDEAAQWYCRPEGPGILMGMGAVETDDLTAPFQTEMVDSIIDVAVHRIPVLEKASMLNGWTGIRPLTPDDRPIIGPVRGIDGLYLNCGWGGEGIIMAPLAGQLLAESICNGQGTTVDIGPLSLERFDCAAS